MSIRCTISLIGPIHIWEHAADKKIYVELGKSKPIEIGKEELEDLVADLSAYLSPPTFFQTHGED